MNELMNMCTRAGCETLWRCVMCSGLSLGTNEAALAPCHSFLFLGIRVISDCFAISDCFGKYESF